MLNVMFFLVENIYKKKNVVFTILFVALFMFPANSSAANCNNPLTQMEMNICAKEAADRSDMELNSVFERLLAKSSVEDASKLQAAKKAWLAYRNSQCEYNASGTRNGSVHPVIISNCYAYLAQEYLKILRQQLDCQEGDLSCVR